MAEDGLLAEVNQLVEAPTALRGSFEADYLRLPPEVLISVMKKHQRYFPVQGKDGLLPYFVAVRNGDNRYLDVVADGNEQVMRARLPMLHSLSRRSSRPLAELRARIWRS